MGRTLRKSSIPVSIGYSTGDFSNNLRAGPCEMDERDGLAYLILDMSLNLRTRDKQENSYIDACELVEKHLDLKRIEIDEGILGKWVALSGVPNRERSLAERRLEIILKNKGTFTYLIVDARNIGGSMVLYLEPGQ